MSMKMLQATAVVFVFWLILAVPLVLADLVWGALVALLVGAWAGAMIWAGGDFAHGLRRFPGLVLYTIDLLRSIVPAAVQVARIILRRSLDIKPVVITHTVGLDSELGRIALANSITLTPGTHCVDLDDGVLTIHCLEERFADTIRDRRIERRIDRMLGPGAGEPRNNE
jgi:multicomponent Na+:H+ antiporter subunit E